MSLSFGFYHDSALTTPIGTGDEADFNVIGTGYADLQIWFGSTATDRRARATSDPGTDQITVTPTDADAITGLATSAVKLATSQAGLTAATAGAALEIGTQVLSGSANAFPFWVRVTSPTDTPAVHLDLSLVTNDLTDSAV
jgi:hypothetical protein